MAKLIVPNFLCMAEKWCKPCAAWWEHGMVARGVIGGMTVWLLRVLFCRTEFLEVKAVHVDLAAVCTGLHWNQVTIIFLWEPYCGTLVDSAGFEVFKRERWQVIPCHVYPMTHFAWVQCDFVASCLLLCHDASKGLDNFELESGKLWIAVCLRCL
jgi:hypothetical protein